MGRRTWSSYTTLLHLRENTLSTPDSIEPLAGGCYSSCRVFRNSVLLLNRETMISLIATIGITASSALLFVYWFRYTCLLILSAKTTRDYAGEFAAATELSFPSVQAKLREAYTAASLVELQASLNRDYAVVTYLLKNVSDNGKQAYHNTTNEESDDHLVHRL